MTEGEIPDKLDELDIEIGASSQLYNELAAVIKKHNGHPKLSTFMVLGCLEALKQDYYMQRVWDRAELKSGPDLADD